MDCDCRCLHLFLSWPLGSPHHTHLAQVLVEIEQKSPAALKRNATEDEVELNVDVIPAALLTELTSFVNGAKKRKTAAGAKKKSKA